MKNLIPSLFLAFSILVTNANAFILNAPFIPEVDSRFNSLENVIKPDGAQIVSEAGNSGLFVQHEAKGIITLAGDVAGTYATPIVLPAKSIITQAFVFVDTAILPSGTTTAIQCVGANDILSAADETGVAANGIIATIETGLAGPMLYSSAGCTVKVVTAVHTATAGKLNIFVKYVTAK